MTLTSNGRLLLGVDGGGTKTTAWLAVYDGIGLPAVIGRATAAGSNPRALGFEAAFQNLNTAVSDSFGAAGIEPRAVDAACLSIAGVGRSEEQARLSDWCRDSGIAELLKLATDAEPVLAAGTPHHFGVALIAGTGSLCFGKTQTGKQARAGGWGHLIGDEGSGYALALAGLQAVARAADGRGPETVLETRFLNRLNLANPMDMISLVYGGDMNRSQLAQLAEIVVETAEAGDHVAIRLMQHAATELAKHVESVVTQLELDPSKVPLALAGGLLVHTAWLRAELVTQLELAEIFAHPITLVPDPVAGAITLARDLLDERTNWQRQQSVNS